MASVFITAWDSADKVAKGAPTDFIVATLGGGASAALAGSGRKRKVVRLYADANCFVQWAKVPSATDGTDSVPLGANNPEYFDIEVGFAIDAITR